MNINMAQNLITADAIAPETINYNNKFKINTKMERQQRTRS